MTRLSLKATLAASVAFGAGAAAAETITGSVWFPDTHPLTSHGYLTLVDTLAEVSGGDLTLQVFTGEAVLPAAAHLSGLSDGIVDMTYHAGTYTPSDLPEDNVLAILGIGLQDNIVIAAAVTEFYMNDPAMQAMFERHEIVFLGGYATPPYILMCRDKVETLADIQGKRIRMPGAIHAQWAEKVGAVPVSVPSTEMFTGLERGQLDCAANAANDLRSRSLWDVARHVTTIDLGSYFSGWLHAMNVDRWRGLDDAQRRALLDSIPDAVVAAAIEYNEQSDAALADAPERGVTIYEPAEDLAEALASFNEDEVPEIARREGEGRFGLDDVDGMIERFQETLERWQGLYADVDRGDADAVRSVLYENLYAEVDEASYGL
jgi:TRAP-type transport system periplasmic protein